MKNKLMSWKIRLRNSSRRKAGKINRKYKEIMEDRKTVNMSIVSKAKAEIIDFPE